MMRTKIGKQEYLLLNELSAGDMFVGFLLSAHSTKRMYTIAYKRAQSKYRDKKSLKRLEEKGFVKMRNKNGEDFVTLTKLGKVLIMQDEYAERIRLKQKNKNKWDGKWRIVTFDIPQTHSELRKMIRTVLFKAGFEKVQQSVYIFPYEYEELKKIIQYIQDGARKFIFYAEAGKISNEKYFLKLFGLKRE